MHCRLGITMSRQEGVMEIGRGDDVRKQMERCRIVEQGDIYDVHFLFYFLSRTCSEKN